jgi:hypothetical protein
MQCVAVQSMGCLPLLSRPSRRLACVPRCFTQQQHGSRPAQQQQEAKHNNLAQANKDLGPYVLWDKALKLRATWDSRAHNQVSSSPPRGFCSRRVIAVRSPHPQPPCAHTSACNCCPAAPPALQAELSSVLALLEEHALDRTITLDQAQGSRGEALTTLTLVCRPDDGDEVAAALLQVRVCAARLLPV